MASTHSLTSSMTANSHLPSVSFAAQLQAAQLLADTGREAPCCCRVLIVDDDEDNLMVAQYAVESFGYQAIPISSGHDAVFAALTQAPDIILLDIVLDGLNGIDVLRHLRQNGIRVPVIAVTALVHGHKVEEIMLAGFAEYVVKPYMIEDLYWVMARALEASKDKEQRVWSDGFDATDYSSDRSVFPYCDLPSDAIAG
ncbi:MAG: response regulator [Cyanobacteria bacterium J06560_5]